MTSEEIKKEKEEAIRTAIWLAAYATLLQVQEQYIPEGMPEIEELGKKLKDYGLIL